MTVIKTEKDCSAGFYVCGTALLSVLVEVAQKTLDEVQFLFKRALLLVKVFHLYELRFHFRVRQVQKTACDHKGKLLLFLDSVIVYCEY